MKHRLWTTVLALALAVSFAVSPGFINASDHDDGETDTKGRNVNLTDVYAFREKDQNSSASADDLILIMNTNPRSVARQQYFFSTNACYDFKITRVNNKNDTPTGQADVILRFKFGDPDPDTNRQSITLTAIRDGFTTTAPTMGTTTLLLDATPIVTAIPVSGSTLTVYAGLREDPFFFDVEQFFRVRAGALGQIPAVGFRPPCPATPCALDFTAGYNVNAIVMRVPIAFLGSSTEKTFDVWATISVLSPEPGSTCATATQVERLARPAINEGLIRTNSFLNALNSVGPEVERAFLDGTLLPPALATLVSAIVGEAKSTLIAFGNSEARANALLAAFLPDVMRIDTRRPSGYASELNSKGSPIRGRKITDDVIDITLTVVTNGAVTSDNVSYTGPNANGSGHKPLLPGFPYLAGPN